MSKKENQKNKKKQNQKSAGVRLEFLLFVLLLPFPRMAVLSLSLMFFWG